MRSFKLPSLRSWVGSALAVAGLNLAVAALAFAQEEGGGSKASSADFSFFTVWILGGGGVGFIFLLPIEVASIATVAFIIEHFVTIQRDKLVPPEVVVELETLLDEEQYEEAINLCEATKNYITNIVGAAIARVGEGYDAMVAAAEAATDEQNLKLQHKISWLPLLGNIGPLMGLFGTVTGMVMAFTQIAMSTGTPSPQELAQGIFTALVTTVWGLIVAMPATFFSYLFKVKVQKLSFELSGVAMEIVERFKPVAEGGAQGK
ncbi:MAG TPA: MotA/TolQ/ExbB proton channel family protein [Planctomycetota bacterium]|jgi:biopolymer transport protein ExbB|nr:MotA/TolQ/ExbB proton channel family protein [Planctomycetota bacterium]